MSSHLLDFIFQNKLHITSRSGDVLEIGTRWKVKITTVSWCHKFKMRNECTWYTCTTIIMRTETKPTNYNDISFPVHKLFVWSVGGLPFFNTEFVRRFLRTDEVTAS